MRFRFYLKENKFLIEKTWGPAWVFYLLGFFGFVVFGFGALSAAVFFFGEEADAIAGGFSLFACLIGLLLVLAGTNSPAKNYSELISIDKAQSSIVFEVSKQPERQIRAHLSELRGIFWIEGYAESFDTDSSSRRKEYILYFIFQDQSSIYIAREHNKPGRLQALVSELQNYLGKKLPKLTAQQLWDKPASERPSLKLHNPYPEHFFQRDLDFKEGKELLSLAKPKRNPMSSAVFFVLLSIFLFAPIIPAIQIFQSGGLASLIAGSFLFFFCIFWYGVIALVLFYHARQLFFVRHLHGFFVRLRFPLFSSLNREMEISTKNLDFLAIHRSKEGHWLLCAHLKNPVPASIGFLMSQGLGSKRPALAYDPKNTPRLLPLAFSKGWAKPKRGALLEDLYALQREIARP